MTSFLEKEENKEDDESEKKFELEMIVNTSKKSESKSIESTNQSEGRNQTLKSD